MKKGYLIGLSLLLAIGCSKNNPIESGNKAYNTTVSNKVSLSGSSSSAIDSIQITRYINNTYTQTSVFSSSKDIVFTNLNSEFSNNIYAISKNNYFKYLNNSTPLIDLVDYAPFFKESNTMKSVLIGSATINQNRPDGLGNYLNDLTLNPITGKFSYQITNLQEATTEGLCDQAKIQFSYSDFARIVNYNGVPYSTSSFTEPSKGLDNLLEANTTYYLPPMLSSRIDNGYYSWWVTLYKDGEEVEVYTVKSKNIIKSGKSLNLKIKIATGSKSGKLSADNLTLILENEEVTNL